MTGFLRAVTAVLAVVVVVAACEKKKFEPPDREQQALEAGAAFRMADFDTLSWASDSVRAFEGNVVYASTCRNCHGTLGEGGTDYAAERELDVPSLVEPEWRWEDQIDSVRHRVFVGHIEGMPTWGLRRLNLRQVDAVSHYLLDVLRPDVLDVSEAGQP